jgi:hypothetical protein
MSLAERVKQKESNLVLLKSKQLKKAGIRQQSWASIEDGKTKASQHCRNKQST